MAVCEGKASGFTPNLRKITFQADEDHMVTADLIKGFLQKGRSAVDPSNLYQYTEHATSSSSGGSFKPQDLLQGLITII